MKYLIFDAGPIISLTLNLANQKQYKLDRTNSNTLSPRYLFGHAGLYSLGGFYG